MDGWFFVLLSVVALVLLAVLEFRSATGIYGWLDVRSAEDADDVRRNIDEYGPEVPGLKVDLLPEPERAAVVAARQAARERRRGTPHQRPFAHR